MEQLNAYIDGELDSSLCKQLESHLETCTDCQVVLNTLNKTIELCRKDGRETTLPPDARQRLLASLGLDDDAQQEG
ncbi:MAG: zf-HC2 domain-containing protein [Brevefilum sp.]|nr:zf-HC2 domain-containing protein [Brevefilum sp.]